MKLLCGHTLEKCPNACDGGPRVTWTPVVGRIFRGYTMDHGPGWRFEPDGQGGGTLTQEGGFFEPAITVRKRPHFAGPEHVSAPIARVMEQLARKVEG